MKRTTEGAGEVVSAFQNDERGFDLQLFLSGLERVNAFQQERGRAASTETRGVKFSRPGKNTK